MKQSSQVFFLFWNERFAEHYIYKYLCQRKLKSDPSLEEQCVHMSLNAEQAFLGINWET